MKQLFLFIFILSGMASFGQEFSTSVRKALKYFNESRELFGIKENSKALKKLDAAIKEDAGFTEAYLLQADIYGEMDSSELQIQSLEKALSLDHERFPRAFILLANAYYHRGSYARAREAYQTFLDKQKADDALVEKARSQIDWCDFALHLINQPSPFQAENLGNAVNTGFDEYWPALTIDGTTLIFTRLLPPGGKPAGFTQYQEDFFVSEQRDGHWEQAIPLVAVNTKNNEGAESISADGRLIFFTACNRPDGFGSCDIYFTRNNDGRWSPPQNAGKPVNSGAWEAQPSISANGKDLYFVSNRQGGHGGMDIWRCRMEGFNSYGQPQWGIPENLGDSINTRGNEMSPFIHPDGETLYFSSDTWMGMGGTDIFYARLSRDSLWQKPVNLGYPINTCKNEQGLIVDAVGNYAYYSSDRPGSKGMDIYRFVLPEKARPTPVSYIRGNVLDRKSRSPLRARVELVDLDSDHVVAETVSGGEHGSFFMCLPLGKEYAFHVSKKGYLFYSDNFLLKEVHRAADPLKMDILLDPVDVGNSVVLRNVFFETDSFRLLDHSKAELDELVRFLAQNPDVEVEIGGHTDNAGSREYNLKLSGKRAESVWQYLISRDIDKNRLTYQGYGMSYPVASNDTPEGRARNRRTECTVTAIRKK